MLRNLRVAFKSTVLHSPSSPASGAIIYFHQLPNLSISWLALCCPVGSRLALYSYLSWTPFSPLWSLTDPNLRTLTGSVRSWDGARRGALVKPENQCFPTSAPNPNIYLKRCKYIPAQSWTTWYCISESLSSQELMCPLRNIPEEPVAHWQVCNSEFESKIILPE